MHLACYLLWTKTTTKLSTLTIICSLIINLYSAASINITLAALALNYSIALIYLIALNYLIAVNDLIAINCLWAVNYFIAISSLAAVNNFIANTILAIIVGANLIIAIKIFLHLSLDHITSTYCNEHLINDPIKINKIYFIITNNEWTKQFYVTTTIDY